MIYLKAGGFFLIALILIFALNAKHGDIPPIAKFLDPFRGFWNNAESNKPQKDTELNIAGLGKSVSVAFDERMIPHIFADNDYDLYFAQGYITAKDRLWQMDFQTRFAAGRLSEVVGAKAIELDRYQRRMGMPYGAENMVRIIEEKYPEVKKITDAYADGVNAYIESLNPKDYPIEFKILDYKPEKWTSLNSALLLKLMSATLAGGSDEFYMSNILKKYGPEITKNLFPDYPFREDPIIPKGTKWDFKPVEIPQVPEIAASATTGIRTKEKVEGIGSNNWAISGSKSASGYPLLANDPHLDLTLPSIWYQVQLTAPGVNVYGVSIPGSPCVIIGFNQKVAWGVTNVGSDVLDWYNIRFKDASHKEYFYNNKWNPVKKRIEKISIRGDQDIIDTVFYTHHGPVVYLDKQKPEKFGKAANIPSGHALRWVAHDGSPDVYTFYLLNRAQNYSDYRKALTYYYAPAQNFAFASADNDIAITPNGYFPLKWNGQGKFLLDGSNPANDWHGRIPAEQNPTVKNPPRGFISSANQSSTDQSYPYYLSWEFGSYNRGHRINSRLSVMNHATVDSLRNLQNDNYSIFAEDILPTLLASLNTEKLSATETEAINLVKNWNKFYNADAIAASIFELWQQELGLEIWDEFSGPVPMRPPSRDRTVELLKNEPKSKWFDIAKTPQKETREDLILHSFQFSVDSLQRAYGHLGKPWEWGKVKHSNVPHLAKIAGFGSKILYNGGSKSSVNALGETNGPSWRMIVALGKTTKAYGVFPGGESGNPGSFFYDDMINTWSDGKLNELLFLNSKTDGGKKVVKRVVLNKK